MKGYGRLRGIHDDMWFLVSTTSIRSLDKSLYRITVPRQLVAEAPWSSLPFTWSHATLRPPALAPGPYAKFGGAYVSSPEVVPRWM